jgi:hypothetical protein
MLTLSYPDADIELSRFEDTQSSCADEPMRLAFEDEVLELFSLSDLLF